MKNAVVGWLLAISAVSAWAVAPVQPTEEEFRSLPEVCVKRLKGTMSRDEMRMYPHLHHYCFGLNFVNRASRSKSAQSRGFNLGNAIDNFDYMVKFLPPGHWMRPQVYVDKGKAHVQAAQHAEAVELFNRAITENPAFEPAYLQLIEALKRTGAQGSALEIATAGLRYIPSSGLIKRAYFELGGKEPLPEPAAKGGAENAEPPAGGEITSSAELPEPQNASPASAESADGGAEESGQDEASKRTAEAARACRFCPPDEIDERWRDSFMKAQEK